MFEHLEIIKQKLFLIESILLEDGDRRDIQSELNEIRAHLEYLHGEEKEWVLAKISEIENDLREKTGRNSSTGHGSVPDRNSSIHRDSSTHGNTVPDRNSFREHNQQLDSYLSITLDNISSLRDQRRFINRASTSLKRGGSGIGSGIDYLKKLKERNETDYKILLGGVVFILFLILLVWYTSK